MILMLDTLGKAVFWEKPSLLSAQSTLPGLSERFSPESAFHAVSGDYVSTIIPAGTRLPVKKICF